MSEIQSIRCDHDGLKMAEVLDGHLILRQKHHGQTHVKIVPLATLTAPAATPHPRKRQAPAPQVKQAEVTVQSCGGSMTRSL